MSVAEVVVSSLSLVLMPLFIANADADVDVMLGAEERAEAGVEEEAEVSVSHGLRRTLDGRKGHTMSSLRARVAGQPKRFLFTAKKPSTAAVPIHVEGSRGWWRGKWFTIHNILHVCMCTCVFVHVCKYVCVCMCLCVYLCICA